MLLLSCTRKENSTTVVPAVREKRSQYFRSISPCHLATVLPSDVVGGTLNEFGTHVVVLQKLNAYSEDILVPA